MALVAVLAIAVSAVPWTLAHGSHSKPPVGFGLRMDLLVSSNPKALLNAAQVMRASWISQEVKWKDIEPEPGRYRWARLDGLILALRPYGIRLLVSVSGTPDWARAAGSDLSYDGPPAESTRFAAFMSALAGRYSGIIAAYEIWPEANIRSRWWTPEGVSPEAYVQLLRQASVAIHGADPMSLVLSGGLAPTGANDNFNVIDDLSYYRRMYAAGVKDVIDGLGVRVDGYNNPPADIAGSSSVATTSYKDHSSFYFRHYESVRAIMAESGAGNQSIWLTSAGWASAARPVSGQEYAADVTEQQQADYLLQALMQVQSQDYVAAIFVNNFNLSTVPGAASDLAAYSLIRRDWSARPAFIALAQFRQGDTFTQPVTLVSDSPPPHVLSNWHPRLRYAFRSP
jgi:hypothetical protein